MKHYRPQQSVRVHADTRVGAISKAKTRLNLPHADVVLVIPSTKRSGEVTAWQVILSYPGESF